VELKVEPIKVFKIESESRHGQFYKVMYDGSRWYCECRSWQFNHEHKGEKDECGKAAPRECKHTREAEHRMRTMGKKAFTVVELGPFNELQEYVGQLVELSRNGQMSPEKFTSFRADMERFKEERQKMQDVLSSVDTMLQVYNAVLVQVSTGL
jgi:hypothetical protein